MSDDPKPKRLGFERKETRPKHDQPCDRLPYESPKALFDGMMEESQDG